MMEARSILNGGMDIDHIRMVALNNTRSGSDKMAIGDVQEINKLGYFVKRK